MPGGQPENGLLPPPPAHPQHMAPSHIEVAHAAGMMHLGGMPVSQSYMDSSSAMMISPGPPPPVATMVTVPSHLGNQQPHDPESYVHHHHQQQQQLLQQQQQQQQHHHDDEQQQHHLAPPQIIQAASNDGSNLGPPLSDEGTMTPPVSHPHLPQHVLVSTGHESVTPEAVTPEPSTQDSQQPPQQLEVVTQEGLSDAAATNVSGASPYQTPVDTPVVHPSNGHAIVVTCAEGQDGHQVAPVVVVSQVHDDTRSCVLPSDEFANPMQHQQQPETASMTTDDATNANQETLVEEEVTMATDTGDNQSDIARLSTSPTKE